jgi:threonine dehydrogenase-like Zn-dependent dehydrogenase
VHARVAVVTAPGTLQLETREIGPAADRELLVRVRECGLRHLCPQMSFVGGEHQGGLSELVAVPARNAVPMGPSVPEGLRVLIEPLAVGVHAAARAGAALVVRP